jgi:acyl-CoA synthetase (AMP-forming)/AMP-acid ligase II
VKNILKELSRYPIGTYADIIYRNALLYPNREAFVYGKERITFSEFNARVNSIVHALQAMGVKKGEVIGVVSWNCLEYLDVYGAAMKGGYIISPINVRLKSEELEYMINYSKSVVLFVGPEMVETINALRPKSPKVKHYISFEGSAPNMVSRRDLLAKYSREEPDVNISEEDPLYIIYTSGTTGVPRGALFTQGRSREDIRTKALEKALEPGDTYIILIPLFHVIVSEMLALFYIGDRSVIIKFFEPAEVLQTIQDEKATDIFVVPTHLAAMLALPDVQKYDVSSVKRVSYGGSPIPVELLERALKVFGPIFVQAYGQSECSIITYLRKEDHWVLDKSAEEKKILNSCGRPCIDTHLRIVDEKGNDVETGEIGEIIILSKHNMIGFWQKPEDTAATIVDGWVHTGDVGYCDEKGYVYIVDRKRDMIISGGENVYSREVEAVLYQHPAVDECAVIGVPDPYWVEHVHGVVTLKKGAKLTPDELITFCKKKLAGYKAVKSVEIVDALPKNASGKILKKELRKKWEIQEAGKK